MVAEVVAEVVAVEVDPEDRREHKFLSRRSLFCGKHTFDMRWSCRHF